MKKTLKIGAIFFACCVAAYFAATRCNINPQHSIGDVVDEFNGVTVHYNGGVNHVKDRNLSLDGYNIGLCYQCVEFVKRYYLQRFGHKMPDSKGHAKDFFDLTLPDGSLNAKRNLVQFHNGGMTKPVEEDIAVFAPSLLNRYGHVAIIAKVTEDSVAIIQQNPGPFGKPRETYRLLHSTDGTWRVENERLLGWLRQPASVPLTDAGGEETYPQ
ncbi:MAG: CHAP domain-containing protein [Candidatus Electronema sp. VV]